MDEDETKKLGIDNPRGYFKVQSDKGNFAPADSAQWYKLKVSSLITEPISASVTVLAL